jgi:hypothetical protein
MSAADSALDPKAIAQARALLRPHVRRERLWPVLCAAAFAAVSALTLATAMVLSPPALVEHVDRGGS